MKSLDENKNGGPTPKTKHRRKIAMIVLGSIFLIIGLSWLVYYLIFGQFEEYTDDDYVNGNLVQIIPQVSGIVVSVNADDTQFVSQGDVIIHLDPADTFIALQHAKADLAQTVREVQQYFENVKQDTAKLNLTRADLKKARLDFKRRVGLVGNKAISREEMQHYQTAYLAALANYRYALHHLRMSRALVANTHLYTHPLVERAKANLKTAYLNYQRINILAPCSGFIAKRSVQVGQQVNTTTPLLAIVPLDQVWIDANYKESQLNHLRAGQEVTLYADAYSDITYHGKIAGLNAGTGAAFSLLPPQNATGNWIKIVQRLPVRVVIDPDELKKNPLEIGLSMRVTANTHDRIGSRLASAKTLQPIYHTNVYERQLAAVNALIMQILKENSQNLSRDASHTAKGKNKWQKHFLP